MEEQQQLVAIRAELKAWEKSFKARQGREPSKADIKANPDIAHKYQVYSKSRLDKAGSASHPAPAPAPAPAPSVGHTRPQKHSLPPVTPTKHASRAGSGSGRAHPEETFKTPTSRPRNGSASEHNVPISQSGVHDGVTSGTDFAFAPSPSKLRALAASRSFSGSPNTKRANTSYGVFNDAPSDPASTSNVGATSVGASPRNLGKSVTLPADTPRTKARRWLAGDAVTPPTKAAAARSKPNFVMPANYGAQPGPSANNGITAGRAASTARSAFWDQVDQSRQHGTSLDEEEGKGVSQPAPKPVGSFAEDNDPEMDEDEDDEDEDFIAPSPVKRLSAKADQNGRAKAKQRQFLDLFHTAGKDDADQDMDSMQDADDSDDPLLRKRGSAAARSAKGAPRAGSAAPRPSVFSAADPSAFAASAQPKPQSKSQSQSHSSYAPAPSKPKKRSSTAAALVPFDNLQEGQEEAGVRRAGAEHLPDITESLALPNGKAAGKGNGKEQSEIETGREEKRPRREVAPATKKDKGKGKGRASEPEDDMADLGDQQATAPTSGMEDDEDALWAELLASPKKSANSNGKAGMQDEEDDYETRDLSDEYEPYRPPHLRRSATPQPPFAVGQSASLSPAPEWSAPAESAGEDALDPQLVSLLSLRTSPVKNRLARLHAKRDETYSALLREPTFLIKQKREMNRKGLEDLEDDEELARVGQRVPGGGEDVGGLYDDGQDVEEDEQREMRAEASDDDWASDAEGWKDLGDGEMDYDDL